MRRQRQEGRDEFLSPYLSLSRPNALEEGSANWMGPGQAVACLCKCGFGGQGHAHSSRGAYICSLDTPCWVVTCTT